MTTESTLGADGVLRSAYVSADLQYRYRLDRTWNRKRGWVLFVMLNPSRADGLKDDHTITQCMHFARGWGYGGLVVANLFAYRSPRPEALLEVDDPVGPENDATLAALRDAHGMTICAWGNNGRLMGRDEAVFNLLTAGGRPVHCLKVTGNGNPYHPRNVPYGTDPKLWINPHIAGR